MNRFSCWTVWGLGVALLAPVVAEESGAKTPLPPGYSRMQAGTLATRFTAETLLPVYRKVSEASQVFSKDIKDACAATLQSQALDQARASWKSLMLAWRTTEPISFGPAPQESLLLKMNPPVQPEIVEALVKKPITHDFLLTEGGLAVRGLGVLEYLLWQNGDVESANKALKNADRCAAMTVIAEDVWRQAQSLRNEANGLHNAMFMDRTSPRRLPAKQLQVASKYIENLTSAFEQGGNDWRSAIVKQSMKAGADGLKMGLFGAGPEAIGLDDYLREMDRGEVSTKLDGQIAALHTAIDALPEPGRKGYSAEQLANVKSSLLAIQQTLKQDASEALALLPKKEAAEPVATRH